MTAAPKLRVFVPPERKRAPRDRSKIVGRHHPILREIAKSSNGLADEEIAANLNMRQHTVRCYRVDLAKAGLLKLVGTRKTDEHHYATVWILTAAGRRLLNKLTPSEKSR